MGSHKKKRKPSTSSDSETSSEEDSSSKRRKRSRSSKKKKTSKKRKRVSSSSDTSTDTSSSSEEKKKSKKKLKKKNKEKKTEEASSDIPVDLMARSKAMAPMTKEEWEKRQSVVRRVYDESTGRHRLIKGDGEVIEEIVSRDRHKAINQQATRGDGDFFQAQTAGHLKK